MSTPNGYVLWEGPSALDGSPIMMIGTGYAKGSQNTKTGAMIQTWILRSDMPPVAAVKEGKDEAICGTCPLRGDGTGKERGCYVNIYWAPGRVFDTYRRHKYSDGRDSLTDLHRGRVVRLGAYGDPAAVPTPVLRAIVDAATSWTGYTHQWRRDAVVLQDLCMASVDSRQEQIEAQARGYRTFRTITRVGDVVRGEILCPASEEAGHRTTCEKCTLCDGAREGDRRKTVAIVVHGAGRKSALKVVQ